MTTPSLNIFNSLPVDQKIDRLSNDGKLLSARVKKGFVIMLYAMDGYFVELWRRHGSQNDSVEAVFTFNTSIGLIPYKKLKSKESE